MILLIHLLLPHLPYPQICPFPRPDWDPRILPGLTMLRFSVDHSPPPSLTSLSLGIQLFSQPPVWPPICGSPTSEVWAASRLVYASSPARSGTLYSHCFFSSLHLQPVSQGSLPSAFLKLACAFFQPQDFSLPAFSLCSYHPSSVHLSGTLLETVVSCVLIVSGSHLLPCPSPLQWCPCPVSLAVAWVTDVCHWCTNSSLLCFFPKPLLSSPYPGSTRSQKSFKNTNLTLWHLCLKLPSGLPWGRDWGWRPVSLLGSTCLSCLVEPCLPALGSFTTCQGPSSFLLFTHGFLPHEVLLSPCCACPPKPVPCLLNACLLCKFHTYGSSSAKPF